MDSPSLIDKSDVAVYCMDITEEESSTAASSQKSTRLNSAAWSTTIDPDEYAILARQVHSSVRSPVKIFTLFRYAKPHDFIALGIAGICAMLSGAALPLTNFILGRVTQDFSNLITKDLSPQEFRPSVNKYALYFVFLGLAVGCLSCISTYILAERGEVLAGRIRKHYFTAIVRQNTAYFEHIGHSEVTKRIIDDTRMVQEAISENLGITISAIASIISALVVGFISSWKITCLMICALAGIALCASFGLHAIHKWDVTKASSDIKIKSLVSQIIKSIHMSAALGASRKHAKRLDECWQNSMILSFNRVYIIALIVSSSWAIMYAAYALGFWQGSREVENNTIDPGSLITAITAIIMGGFTLSTIWPTIYSINMGVESGGRIFETIDRVSTVDATSDEGYILDNLEGKVEFKNVRLRFPSNPGQVVIDNFSLTVQPGETVAIVGPPGSGKTALLGLLERYYDPVKGRIFIDDIDISKLNIQLLRQHIAYVSQEPFLFAGTIYENVAQGLDSTMYANQEPSVRLQMITKACRDANAWGFILSMKDGLESQVGERGCLLSISQRQRVAIARAIVSQPKIFLLDEATSALSTRSGMYVQEALSNISKSLTTLVITQKLSVLRNAQRIIVIQDGMISEQGTHLELVSKAGWYSSFVEKQRNKEVRDKNPLLMFNKERKASELTVRSGRGGAGNMAFDILDWNLPVDSNIPEIDMPTITKTSLKASSLSSSSLIGMVSIFQTLITYVL